MAVAEPGLTFHGKNTMMHLSGCGIQLVSKKGRLSRTPALHLFPTHAEDSSPRLMLSSSSSSFSSSSSVQDQTRVPPQPTEREKEAENLPPRRPLKLAPLELPLEVMEAQRQKIKNAHRETKVTSGKLEAKKGKSKACEKDPPAKSPERSPLSTITESHKPQQRATGVLILPATQVKQGSDRPMGKEVGHVEGHPTEKPALPSHPPSLRQKRQTQVQPAHAAENTCQSEHGISQSAVTSKNQDSIKRRLRLRRTQRLEEDQSKSSSSTGGLSADDGKLASAGSGKGQHAAEKALKEASRVLEKASWWTLREPEDFEMEGAGKVGSRMAVNDIQEVAL